jgi:RNA polymerase sigma-70 factor (ECF subfamily)
MTAHSSSVSDPSGITGRRLAPLLQAARVGSKDAMGALFEACRDYLLLVANDQLGVDLRQKAAPSDLVQQSLAEACQDFPKFTGTSDGEVLIWLRRILLNNITDMTRGYRGTAKREIGREVPLVGDDSADAMVRYLASPEPSPIALAVASEEQRLLELALARMPIHYVEVIRLRNLDYRSFPEIGVALDLSADSARKLWERAVERLTRELSSYHGNS